MLRISSHVISLSLSLSVSVCLSVSPSLIKQYTWLTVQQGLSCDGGWHRCTRSHARHNWCTGWLGHTTETVNIHHTWAQHSTAQPSPVRCLDPDRVARAHGACTRGDGSTRRQPLATGGSWYDVCACISVYMCVIHICVYIVVYTHLYMRVCVRVCVRVCMCVCVPMITTWLVRTFVFRSRQLSQAFFTVCCCGCWLCCCWPC